MFELHDEASLDDEDGIASEAESPEAPVRPHGLLWDIFDEHLDEAAYAITRFERGLESPTLTLYDLARYPEAGLTAHVDALVLGDALVREHVLLPVLREANADDPDRLSAAALALIEAGRFDDLVPFLGHDLPEVRLAVARAGRLASHDGLDAWLSAQAERCESSLLRAGLLSFGAMRGLLLHPVLDALQSDDTHLALAAAQAVLHGEPSRYLPLIDHLLEHDSVQVRDAAALAALAWDSQQAWWKVRQWALDPAQPSSFATTMLAALGTLADQDELAALLPNAKATNGVLFALGFSGHAGLLSLLSPYLESAEPVQAQLAAQALGITYGFLPADDMFAVPPAPPKPDNTPIPPPEDDPEAEATLPPLSDEELEAELVPVPEQELPMPNAQAIRAFCTPRAGRHADKRVLYGEPYDAKRVLSLLESCPLRWRHVLGTALFIRSSTTIALHTRLRSARQRAQLSAVPQRSLTRFMAW